MAFQTDGTKIQLASGGSSWIHEDPGTNPFTPEPYVQYPHFGKEDKELTLIGNVEGGETVEYILDNVGHILLKLYFRIRVKDGSDAIAWSAEKLFDSIQLFSGDTLLDQYSYPYYRHYYNFCLNQDKKSTWDKMTSAIGVDGSELYLPVVFGFCRHEDQSMPTIGLINKKIRIEVRFQGGIGNRYDKSNISLWGTVAYLQGDPTISEDSMAHEVTNFGDAFNRVKFTNELLLLNTTQYETEFMPINLIAHTEALHMAGMVKELTWDFVNSENTTYPWYEPLGPHTVTPSPTIGTYTQPHQSTGVIRISEPIYRGHMDSAQFIFDKKPLFSLQTEQFFNLVQPYWYHSGCPAPGYYMYSWALQPEITQPTGHLNASMFQQKEMNFNLNVAAKDQTRLRWYADIMSLVKKEGGTMVPISKE